ncbi:MAG: ATP-binding protein [Planctomycetaceae bacterium]|nr:ATP-binding protein [Planctomycetaceae bacterium]
MLLDPAVLFGNNRPSSRTRISVINLIGLPVLEAQRHFLNQLVMTLFTWIKKNPNPGQRPLRGLLVIDEAKDFVPSQKASVCKESLTRLVAQARKYHLGLVFATQNPKDIESKIVANCSTHYYGKVNSPAAIDAVRGLIQSKGGTGEDVSILPRGRFYVYNADAHMFAPTKVSIPLCLSRHPDNPLEEAQILKKAAASRERVSS